MYTISVVRRRSVLEPPEVALNSIARHLNASTRTLFLVRLCPILIYVTEAFNLSPQKPSIDLNESTQCIYPILRHSSRPSSLSSPLPFRRNGHCAGVAGVDWLASPISRSNIVHGMVYNRSQRWPVPQTEEITGDRTNTGLASMTRGRMGLVVEARLCTPYLGLKPEKVGGYYP